MSVDSGDIDHGSLESLIAYEYIDSLRPPHRKSRVAEEQQDHYAVLGLGHRRVRATPLQIKNAYRRKVLQYHPDKIAAVPGVDKDPHFFICITRAWQVLGNPKLRRAYDLVDPYAITRQRRSQPDPVESFFVKTLKLWCNSRWGDLWENKSGVCSSAATQKHRLEEGKDIIDVYLEDCCNYSGVTLSEQELASMKRMERERELERKSCLEKLEENGANRTSSKEENKSKGRKRHSRSESRPKTISDGQHGEKQQVMLDGGTRKRSSSAFGTSRNAGQEEASGNVEEIARNVEEEFEKLAKEQDKTKLLERRTRDEDEIKAREKAVQLRLQISHNEKLLIKKWTNGCSSTCIRSKEKALSSLQGPSAVSDVKKSKSGTTMGDLSRQAKVAAFQAFVEQEEQDKHALKLQLGRERKQSKRLARELWNRGKIMKEIKSNHVDNETNATIKTNNQLLNVAGKGTEADAYTRYENEKHIAEGKPAHIRTDYEGLRGKKNCDGVGIAFDKDKPKVAVKGNIKKCPVPGQFLTGGVMNAVKQTIHALMDNRVHSKRSDQVVGVSKGNQGSCAQDVEEKSTQKRFGQANNGMFKGSKTNSRSSEDTVGDQNATTCHKKTNISKAAEHHNSNVAKINNADYSMKKTKYSHIMEGGNSRGYAALSRGSDKKCGSWGDDVKQQSALGTFATRSDVRVGDDRGEVGIARNLDALKTYTENRVQKQCRHEVEKCSKRKSPEHVLTSAVESMKVTNSTRHEKGVTTVLQLNNRLCNGRKIRSCRLHNDSYDNNPMNGDETGNFRKLPDHEKLRCKKNIDELCVLNQTTPRRKTVMRDILIASKVPDKLTNRERRGRSKTNTHGQHDGKQEELARDARNRDSPANGANRNVGEDVVNYEVIARNVQQKFDQLENKQDAKLMALRKRGEDKCEAWMEASLRWMKVSHRANVWKDEENGIVETDEDIELGIQNTCAALGATTQQQVQGDSDVDRRKWREMKQAQRLANELLNRSKTIKDVKCIKYDAIAVQKEESMEKSKGLEHAVAKGGKIVTDMDSVYARSEVNAMVKHNNDVQFGKETRNSSSGDDACVSKALNAIERGIGKKEMVNKKLKVVNYTDEVFPMNQPDASLLADGTNEQDKNKKYIGIGMKRCTSDHDMRQQKETKNNEKGPVLETDEGEKFDINKKINTCIAKIMQDRAKCIDERQRFRERKQATCMAHGLSNACNMKIIKSSRIDNDEGDVIKYNRSNRYIGSREKSKCFGDDGHAAMQVVNNSNDVRSTNHKTLEMMKHIDTNHKTEQMNPAPIDEKQIKDVTKGFASPCYRCEYRCDGSNSLVGKLILDYTDAIQMHPSRNANPTELQENGHFDRRCVQEEQMFALNVYLEGKTGPKCNGCCYAEDKDQVAEVKHQEGNAEELKESDAVPLNKATRYWNFLFAMFTNYMQKSAVEEQVLFYKRFILDNKTDPEHRVEKCNNILEENVLQSGTRGKTFLVNNCTLANCNSVPADGNCSIESELLNKLQKPPDCKWSTEEDQLFLLALKRNEPATGVWEKISGTIPGRNEYDCLLHFAQWMVTFEERKKNALSKCL